MVHKDGAARRQDGSKLSAASLSGDPGSHWLALSIKSVMLRDPATVGIRNTVREVQALMNRYGAGHVPVVEGGRAVGLVTARDIARSLPVPFTMLGRGEMERLLALPVGMIMSAPVTSIDTRATVATAVEKMVQRDVGAIVVCEADDGRMVGLVTRSIVLALLAEVADQEQETTRAS